MPAAFSGLAAVFGAALAPLTQDGVWHATTLSDTGVGGVSPTAVDVPVRLVVEGLSAEARLGLPRDAVRLVVLRGGLTGAIRLDDSVSVDGATYRVVQADADPAGVSFSLVGVPA